jgi:hypothetical protein
MCPPTLAAAVKQRGRPVGSGRRPTILGLNEKAASARKAGASIVKPWFDSPVATFELWLTISQTEPRDRCSRRFTFVPHSDRSVSEPPASNLMSEFHCGAFARRYRQASSRAGQILRTQPRFELLDRGRWFFQIVGPLLRLLGYYPSRRPCLIHFSGADPKAFC